MKKKLLALLLMSACVFTSLTGCGGEDAKEGQTSSGGQKFTVGFDAEYPPYGYMDDNGDYTGFDEELRDKVNKSLHDLKANGKFDELAKKYELSEMTCLE